MGFSHSPKTVTEDLVFIYDTGNGKSFRGEPTVNLATDTPTQGGWGGGYTVLDSSAKAFEFRVNNFSGSPGAGWRSWMWDVSAYTGTQITITADVELITATTGTFAWLMVGQTSGSHDYLGYAPTNNKYVKYSTTAERITWTGEIGYGTKVGFTLWVNDGTPTVDFPIRVSNVQIENKAHATPFVNGTRSATESLKDIRVQNFLDVTNTSYDSNGVLTFDGSSDHITGVLPISGGGEPHTIEMVLSPDINQSSFGSRRDPFSIGNATLHQYSALDISPGFMNWYFYSRDTTFTNNPTLVAGQYYHFILSYTGGFSNNTNKRVWINGIEQTLSTGVNEVPLLPDNPEFSVGRDRGRNTAYFPGEIPVFKVYKKGLTEKEALANFNAIRGRFNI